MKRIVSTLLLALVMFDSAASAGIGGKTAMYVGGTAKIKEMTEGRSSTADDKFFVFEYKKGKQPITLKIPYDRVNNLEYGQKAGRRLGLAIAVSPLALFSKKRKHYLTIGYLDAADKQEALVFELGKDIIRTTLATVEARTGRKVEFQDEEARKSGKGN
jgi:hypothetical protein